MYIVVKVLHLHDHLNSWDTNTWSHGTRQKILDNYHDNQSHLRLVVFLYFVYPLINVRVRDARVDAELAGRAAPIAPACHADHIPKIVDENDERSATDAVTRPVGADHRIGSDVDASHHFATRALIGDDDDRLPQRRVVAGFSRHVA